MHNQVNALFDCLWQDYLSVTPSAVKVHQLLASDNETIVNDHIALRTFNLDSVSLDKLATHFLQLGYVEAGEYHFAKKKLYAKHFEHTDPDLPKVFISELLVEQFSDPLQQTVAELVEQVPAAALSRDDFLYSGRYWQTNKQTYQDLLAESEYAAWLCAFGYRANHFTVNVNRLLGEPSLQQVNDKLKQAGFVLNTSGGEIKGSAEVLLEQSSTMADKTEVEFADGVVQLPSCFYEFAKRYPQTDGRLYSGFVAASADKIFESTNTS